MDSEPSTSHDMNALDAIDQNALTLDSDNAQSISDLDVSSILYITEISEVDESNQKDLQKLRSDVDKYLTLETQRSEAAVQQKAKDSLLPSNNLLQSKAKRTSYRLKVIDYLRSNSSWSVLISLHCNRC